MAWRLTPTSLAARTSERRLRSARWSRPDTSSEFGRSVEGRPGAVWPWARLRPRASASKRAFASTAIDEALQFLGVEAAGDRDEFDIVGLGGDGPRRAAQRGRPERVVLRSGDHVRRVREGWADDYRLVPLDDT
jgi:hypothetical protein